MAVTEVAIQKLDLNEWEDIVMTSLTSASDGAALAFDGKDGKILVIATNGGQSAATVTVKKGDGIQGVTDIAAYSIGAGETAAIRLDSGAFKNTTGDNKGAVLVIGSSTDLDFGLIELP